MSPYKIDAEAGIFSEPLRQDNILQTAYEYLRHYLFYHNWIWQYLVVLLFLYGLYKLLTRQNCAAYPQFLPSQKYPCSLSGPNNCCGAAFCALCLIIYMANLYAQEMSFFASYDAMGPNNMRIFHQGVTPLWGYNRRFSPVAFWDVNLVYAVTHNFWLINSYVLAQVLLIVWLFFRLLNFIPVGKRCYIVGLVIIAPQFMWINSIVFPERLLLIYILCGLIFFQKYGQAPRQSSNLWYGIVFANLAIYTKESTILLYFGILLYSFVYNLARENITLKSFAHPLRTARQFPLEMLLAASMAVFAAFYLCNVYAITDSPYVSIRRRGIGQAVEFYRWELAGLAAAVAMWLIGLKNNRQYFLSGGLLWGSVALALFVVFVLRLLPFSNQVAAKNYYLLLPATFALIYILQQINRPKIFLMLTAFLFVAFSVQNMRIFNKEEGKYYRQTAQFITSLPEPLSIFISANSEPRPWWASCWLTAYKYYWPQKKMLFKIASFQRYPNDAMFLPYWNLHPELFHASAAANLPAKGDIYVVKTNGDKYEADMLPLSERPHRLIYQNPIFEIYQVE